TVMDRDRDRDRDLKWVKIKAHYRGDMLITDIPASLTFDQLCEEVKMLCSVARLQPITLKWMDDEGDPCTISSQRELQEALRLHRRHRRSGLLLHVFPSVPQQPGMACPGEDKSIYRGGARRWRRLHRVNGHLFQTKRFTRKAPCGSCADSIWGLRTQQGYKCINCKVLLHKRCHRLLPLTCPMLMDPVMPSQEPPPDDKSEEDLPAVHGEDADGSETPLFLAHERTEAKTEESEDISAVVDGIGGMKLSQDLVLGLPDFELIRVIGRGSYAKVLLVRLKKNDQMYAMKVVKKELVHDDEDIDWVQTEKHVFEQASSNPFLVGLHSCFQTQSRLFLVIEYVKGGDLMFHMQRQRKLPEEHARFYAAEICIALNFLHEKGIIYRDLKLDNVLLDHDGHVKLTDYGMCKEGIQPGDTTSTFCGTPNYIAPEILRGEDYGFSVDWWALGVLMFEMMAGRSPFDIVTDNPDMNTEEYLFQVILEKPIRIPRSLSVKAASVLKGFLNKDPKDRLGCQVQMGFTDVQSHTFFRSIDWNQLEQKQVTPPFKPQISDDYGLENFDTQFTNEPVQLTPDDEDVIKRIDQSEFEGFEYINPLLLSMEESV
uniref:Protein kinase C n=1 Tax=Tetraodon nigroviridis TaxID=99883 RepID=H3C6F2_TETNG